MYNIEELHIAQLSINDADKIRHEKPFNIKCVKWQTSFL